MARPVGKAERRRPVLPLEAVDLARGGDGDERHAQGVGEDGRMHGFGHDQPRPGDGRDHRFRLVARIDIGKTGGLANGGPDAAHRRFPVRDEDRLVDFRQALELRHVGGHHRRVDDAERLIEPELCGRQRPAHAADVPFAAIGKVRHGAVAEPAADHQFPAALRQKVLVEHGADADQKHLGVCLAKARQQEVPQPQVQVVAEIAVL